jgi:phage terminase large subunit
MNNLGIDKKKYCFADYARPEIIEDLRRAGYNMKEAVKDVKEGIMSVKMNKIFVDKTSLNVWKEFKMYSWKTNKEQILDEPVKLYDDAMDALRYAIYTTEKRGRYDKKYVGFF